MTYLEKLIEIHPELTEQGIREVIKRHCPHHFGFEISRCSLASCRECWGREMEGCSHGQEQA